jgi:dTDP-4-amino-4,6-dideoxygalactose transaminase
MAIPFIDLKTQYLKIEPEVRRRMDAVLEHGKFIMGPEVGEIEAELAAYCGAEYCVSCASGTDALLMALMAHGVGPGDAVFTTPFTFIATAEVVSLLGATPVFVDIEPDTFNISPALLEKAVRAVETGDSSVHPLPAPAKEGKLTPKGVIPVDLFGLPADYRAIGEIAAGHGLFVLEDAAQSFGAEYKGRRACGLGHTAAASFFPAKPLGCYGDGGAVFTDDAAFAETLKSIRVHGKGTHKYDNARIGLNARLDTLQAAVLLAKMTVFPVEIDARRAAASEYGKHLLDTPGVTPPFAPDGYASAWAQYSILVDDREAVRAALKEMGVPSAVYYPKPLHLQTAFAPLGYKPGDMTVSEDASLRIMSLPMHPYLDPAAVENICGAVAEAVALQP